MGRRTECPCGSGEFPDKLTDARGIFCCYTCPKCEAEKRAKYDPRIFENSRYEADDLGEPE